MTSIFYEIEVEITKNDLKFFFLYPKYQRSLKNIVQNLQRYLLSKEYKDSKDVKFREHLGKMNKCYNIIRNSINNQRNMQDEVSSSEDDGKESTTNSRE